LPDALHLSVMPPSLGLHQAAARFAAPREFHPSEVISELPPLVATDSQRGFRR
jgi:hypothetical protein